MAAGGHFIFELFKIAILSAAYATILLWIKFALNLKKGGTRFSWSKFFRIYLILYSVLFLFSFTYYGDHGLGDECKIPLGHGETMSSADLDAYFAPKEGGNLIDIKSYLISNNDLCAATDSGYLVYNLKTGKRIEFDNSQEYRLYALGNTLPNPDLFLDFFKQYDNYWSGWRFWTMP